MATYYSQIKCNFGLMFQVANPFTAAFVAAVFACVNIGSAQTNVSSATTTPSNYVPSNISDGGGRRGVTNTHVFPPEETNHLAALGNRGIQVHDPSTLIKCKDEYWVFYTGFGVPSWHSSDLIHWERGPNAITNRPSWTTNVSGFNGRSYWAPDVAHIGNHYLLYYSASIFGKNTSGIGLATNPTLDPKDPDFKWTDEGMVIGCVASNNFNTIDPAITLAPDGKLWLVFGSYWSGIKLIELNPKTGLRIAPDSPMYALAHNDSIEASFIYHHGDYFYLFVNWGTCCRGASSTYEIRVGRSKKITGPYMDRDGKDLLLGGGSEFLKADGAFIGPGHAGILEDNGKFLFGCHFYDGTTPRGTSKYAIRPLRWADDGWPVAELNP